MRRYLSETCLEGAREFQTRFTLLQEEDSLHDAHQAAKEQSLHAHKSSQTAKSERDHYNAHLAHMDAATQYGNLADRAREQRKPKLAKVATAKKNRHYDM